MPSPRSVLIDLDTHGLHYDQPHSTTSASGHLKVKRVVEEKKTPAVADLKPGLVQLASTPTETVVEILADEVTSAEVEQPSDEAADKGKKGRKKKDAS